MCTDWETMLRDLGHNLVGQQAIQIPMPLQQSTQTQTINNIVN